MHFYVLQNKDKMSYTINSLSLNTYNKDSEASNEIHNVISDIFFGVLVCPRPSNYFDICNVYNHIFKAKLNVEMKEMKIKGYLFANLTCATSLCDENLFYE